MAVRTLGERVSARIRFGHTRERTFCGQELCGSSRGQSRVRKAPLALLQGDT